jgi:hydroxycarboxylate dehydrogenase B
VIDPASHRTAASISFSPAALTRVVLAVVRQGGSAPEEAALVADNLVLANASGHASHGVGMLPRYIDSLLEGGLLPNQHVQVALDTGVLLRLDGGSGYGQVIGREAMALGCERALAHGVCVVALGNAHHLGRIGHWAEQCLEHGLVSCHFVNVVSRPIVAPFGGLDARTGTNPVCVGVPRRDGDPIVLDFATSRIAQGKARVAYNRGEPIAPGNIIDDRGEATTDPRYSVLPPYGAILPFGEHKGFGLSLVAELLGGALGGGLTCHEPRANQRRILNGMLSILIHPDRLGSGAAFAAETEAYLDWLRRSPAPEGGSGVSLPGEPERRERQRCAREGITLDTTTWEEIIAAAAQVGVSRATCEALAADVPG